MQAKENKQSKFISQAEQILKYQSSTPSRFRSRPPHVVPTQSAQHGLASVPQGSKSSLRKASVVETLVESSLKIHGSQVQTKSSVTIPEPFTFNTIHRADEREKFERDKRQKEANAEEERELEKQRKEKELDDQLVETRKALVHKAQPVRNYKPLQIKKSARRVTLPVSPHLGVPKGANCSR